MTHKVAILGATSWGTTLACVLATKGVPTVLLARSSEEASGLDAARENQRFLPGIRLPDSLAVEPVGIDLAGIEAAIVVVPSQRVRENVRLLAPSLPPSTILVSASKGIEAHTCMRMTQVLAEEAPGHAYCALSGPNISREIALGLPASTVVASDNVAAARTVQSLFMTTRFRVYAHDDVVGVELGGALKNVIALGAGIIDGLRFGDNAKAAFMTRGLAEISRLGVAAGANPLTFAGLAGVGDLIVTCSSPHSRNRFVGQELAKGRTLAEISATMDHVSEGVPTTASARELAVRLGVEMPITAQIHRVLFEGRPVPEAIEELMARAATDEWAGMSVEGPRFTP